VHRRPVAEIDRHRNQHGEGRERCQIDNRHRGNNRGIEVVVASCVDGQVVQFRARRIKEHRRNARCQDRGGQHRTPDSEPTMQIGASAGDQGGLHNE
jgi:hypothetical protein